MPANRSGRTGPPIFRRHQLSASELADFQRAFEDDGYVVLDGCFTDAGSDGLAEEMLANAEYLAWDEIVRTTGVREPERFGLRPWDEKGPWSDREPPCLLPPAVYRADPQCHPSAPTESAAACRQSSSTHRWCSSYSAA